MQNRERLSMQLSLRGCTLSCKTRQGLGTPISSRSSRSKTRNVQGRPKSRARPGRGKRSEMHFESLVLKQVVLRRLGNHVLEEPLGVHPGDGVMHIDGADYLVSFDVG
jgi:hypothetical protein